MCGIFGIWNLDGRPVDVAAVERAVATMRHRGPDGEGYVLIDTRGGRAVECAGADTDPSLGLPPLSSFAGEGFDLALGHRRLAILDTSVAGHQPMAGAGRKAWIVHSGEIYDYLELRERFRGEREFRTQTDTEVLLALYELEGPDIAWDPPSGMWGTAIFDIARRLLFCWRDPFGIKPFHYVRRGSTFAFASEIKALLAATGERPSWDEGVVLDHLAWGMTDHRPGTSFRGVRSLPPAHLMLLEPDRQRLERYWAPHPGSIGLLTVGGGRAEPTPVVRDFLEGSVRRHLRSDVPVGTCLSGGIDSSSIVCLAAPMLAEAGAGHQKVFTAVFAGAPSIDERRFVDEVVRATGAEPHTVEPTPAGLLNELPGLALRQEQPFVSVSVYAQWCVMRLAKEAGVTVLLDGQGGDELFSGYPQAYDRYLARSLVTGRWWRLRDPARALRAAIPRVMTGAERWPAWLDPELVREHGLPQDWRYPRYGSLHQVMENDLEFRLPALLRYEERNSMAFGIEARVPFLAGMVAALAHTLKDSERIRDGLGKAVLRDAMRGIVPDPVLDRRDKIGFATPQDAWLLGPLRPRVKEMVLEGAVRLPFFDAAELRRALAAYEEGETTDTSALWRWVSLCAWADAFFR